MAHKLIESAHDLDESLAISDSFIFSTPSTAPYVNGQQSATFYANNNNYSSYGIKTIQIPLQQSYGYLVPSSFKNQFKITNKNTAANPITLINPSPSIFFYRYRLVGGGQQWENMGRWGLQQRLFVAS